MASRCEQVAAIARPPRLPFGRLGHLIESIGNTEFETRFSELVEDVSGADQLYLFQVDRSGPKVRNAFSANGSSDAIGVAKAYADGNWFRFDTPMNTAYREATAKPCLYRTDLKHASSDHLRNTLYGRMKLRDRIMVCGRAADDVVGMSVLRSVDRGLFSDDQQIQLENLAQLAFPLLVSHWATLNRESRLSRALTDLELIERCIELAPEGLPPRERAVCARYLYGQCTAGISADLTIGEETVVTYRKRLYERLGIGSHRELLLWYLDLYGNVRTLGLA